MAFPLRSIAPYRRRITGAAARGPCLSRRITPGYENCVAVVWRARWHKTVAWATGGGKERTRGQVPAGLLAARAVPAVRAHRRLAVPPGAVQPDLLRRVGRLLEDPGVRRRGVERPRARARLEGGVVQERLRVRRGHALPVLAGDKVFPQDPPLRLLGGYCHAARTLRRPKRSGSDGAMSWWANWLRLLVLVGMVKHLLALGTWKDPRHARFRCWGSPISHQLSERLQRVHLGARVRVLATGVDACRRICHRVRVFLHWWRIQSVQNLPHLPRTGANGFQFRFRVARVPLYTVKTFQCTSANRGGDFLRLRASVLPVACRLYSFCLLLLLTFSYKVARNIEWLMSTL
jgi:hypothetical protein